MFCIKGGRLQHFDKPICGTHNIIMTNCYLLKVSLVSLLLGVNVGQIYAESSGCNDYLVNGATPIPDSQLTSSSFWCQDHPNPATPDCAAARYARLNATGWLTGAWVPIPQDTNPWIQADFGESKLVLAIVLNGRDPVQDVVNYVKSFTVSVSENCNDWKAIADAAGNPVVFVGTTGPDVKVTRELPKPEFAKCVRLHPLTWQQYAAVRFDVIGCTFGCTCSAM